ncbi:hypothetical protein [Streptomyces sp. NPDC050507]|uniref:hypothetical protein n=1 Tax=Streptomyces sp. NPDC050507 TaxID=3365619 RepID=UPI0037B1A2BC
MDEGDSLVVADSAYDEQAVHVAFVETNNAGLMTAYHTVWLSPDRAAELAHRLFNEAIVKGLEEHRA